MQHRLRTSMILPLPREETFAFFADAANLGRITPPELGFEILTPAPIEMRDGARIEYRIRLFGMPMHWRSRIESWHPPREFVDVQERGPYREWIHTHRFHERGRATEIEDEVVYSLPFPPVGELGHRLVRWQLDRIFRYRRKEIRRLLAGR